MTTEDDIDNIVGFLLDEYNVDVVFDDDETGTYSPDARVIGIKDTDPEEEQLFVLLHEAGHAKIHRDKRNLRERRIASLLRQVFLATKAICVERILGRRQAFAPSHSRHTPSLVLVS